MPPRRRRRQHWQRNIASRSNNTDCVVDLCSSAAMGAPEGRLIHLTGSAANDVISRAGTVSVLRAGLDDSAQVGARDWYRRRGECRFERSQQAVLVGNRAALRPDNRQRQEVPVVAGKPRKQAGAQKRRLSRARSPENHEQPRRASRSASRAADPTLQR